MLTLVPLIVWTSFSLSIFSSLFVPMMIQTMPENGLAKENLQKATEAMIFLGVGAVAGGLFNGWLLDLLGYKRAILVNMV